MKNILQHKTFSHEDLDEAIAVHALGWRKATDDELSAMRTGSAVWITNEKSCPTVREFRPSTEWEHGGPIIDRYIHLIKYEGGWKAEAIVGLPCLCFDGNGEGSEILEACMRAIVEACCNAYQGKEAE